ncbi:MAG TPA: DUF3347 domain-containing protein [Puia sp.]|jgi:hypothetical protein|nr:DUF3347 domain-containing protein [Puia sp.]
MKTIFSSLVILAALSFAGCNSGSNAPSASDSTQTKSSTDTTKAKTAATPISAIVGHYLHLKNALANDDGNDAAVAGKAMVEAMDKLDTSSLTSEQKKAYRDVADDARENAEHIGANAGKIAHQREHFDMLSKDLYDLVKKIGAGQTLYQDYCPMYNNSKGATWISETKDIKNPYLGKEMDTCGSVKEEIK